MCFPIHGVMLYSLVFMWKREMEGLFKALGFGSSKPEYAEKIPEDLLAEDFSLHEVSSL